MLLTVGQIIRPHGVRGEVLVDVRTDEPEARFREGSVLIAGPSHLTVTAARPHLGRLIVRFAEIPDRDAAEAARGTVLEVDSASVAPPSDPDEYHDHQLVGLAVETVDGEPIGSVQRVEHAPASDLLVVSRPGGRLAYVPFVRAMVPTVDLAQRRVVIDPPPGLLDL